LLDAATSEIVDMNSSGENLLKQKKQDVVGRSFSDFARYLGAVDDAHKAGGRSPSTGTAPCYLFCDEQLQVAAEALTSPVIVLGGRQLVVTSLRSLDGRETALREYALRAAIEYALPCGLLVLDDTGSITRVNEKLCGMLGVSALQLIGRCAPFPFWPEPEFERFTTLRTNEGTDTLETTMRRGDGTEFLVDIQVARIAHQAASGWLLTVLDVSDRNARQARLEQQRRLEGLGRMAGQVAHDFNNLLSVISVNTSIALSSAEANNHLPQLKLINQAAQRGRDITKGLLSVAQDDGSLNAEIFDVTKHLVEIKEFVRSFCGLEHEVIFDISSHSIWIAADKSQLDSVMMNLVVNARDAMKGPGRITVRITLGSLKTDKISDGGVGCILEVTDEGSGMSADVRQRAFEPFFTTKKEDNLNNEHKAKFCRNIFF
jgi:PAS domain S-box-containing protein